MTLNNIKNNKKNESGFTIVELLIVIVIIGILAALVIIAYSGITNRAKAQSAQATASALQKKIEAYAADQSGTYPAMTTASGLTTALNNVNVSNISSSGISIAAVSAFSPTSAGDAIGQKSVAIESCTAGGTGYRIRYWDYTTATLLAGSASTYTGNTTGTCTTWTAAT